MSVGMPAQLALDRFGFVVQAIFGEIPYWVGSSLPGNDKKAWRDVDVRLMLSDERYAAMGLGDPKRPHDNERWCVIAEYVSNMGRQMTGLPIDFQIQQVSAANAEFKDPRSALGCVYQLRGDSRNGPSSPGRVEETPVSAPKQ